MTAGAEPALCSSGRRTGHSTEGNHLNSGTSDEDVGSGRWEQPQGTLWWERQFIKGRGASVFTEHLKGLAQKKSSAVLWVESEGGGRGVEDEKDEGRGRSEQCSKCSVSGAGTSWFIPLDIIRVDCSLSWGELAKVEIKRTQTSDKLIHFCKQTKRPQSSQADSPHGCRFRFERAGCKTPTLPCSLCC